MNKIIRALAGCALAAVILALVGCAEQRAIRAAQVSLDTKGCEAGITELTEVVGAYPESNRAVAAWQTGLSECLEAAELPREVLIQVLGSTQSDAVPLGSSLPRVLESILEVQSGAGVAGSGRYELSLTAHVAIDAVSVLGVDASYADGTWIVEVPEPAVSDLITFGGERGTVTIPAVVSFRGERLSVGVTGEISRASVPIALSAHEHGDGTAEFFATPDQRGVLLVFETAPQAEVEVTLWQPDFHGRARADGQGRASVFVPGINRSVSGLATSSANGHAQGSAILALSVRAQRQWLTLEAEDLADVAEGTCSGECAAMSFRELQANTGAYSGVYVRFSGRVNQTQVDEGLVFMRVGVANYGTDNIGVAYPANHAEFLADDRVTIYGEIVGPYTYTSQAGWQITIPLIRPLFILDGRGRATLTL